MEYKGYTAVVAFDERDEVFHGHLTDTYDDVFFEGRSVDELERSFRSAVDDYLSYCQANGREPTKPFSGRLNIRLNSDLHRRAAIAAHRQGISLNRLITEAVQQMVD